MNIKQIEHATAFLNHNGFVISHDIPELIAVFKKILDQIDPDNTTVGLGNILNARAILKQIEG